MKNCIIVNFFVSTIEQEYLLTKSLESMSDLGYDIILSTNSPISKEIQSLCTHVIYNKKNRLKQKGENNSQFGSCWITNGIENKKIKKDSNIPQGWYVGRKIK